MDVDCRKVSNEFLLERYGELLDIPLVKEYLCLTLKATMVKFRDRIAMYMNLKNKYRELAYGEMQVCEGEAQIRHHVYRFNLIRISGQKWRVTKIEPDLPEEITLEDILPEALIDKIVLSKIDSQEMQRIDAQFNVSGRKRSFKVQYTKYSEESIMGVVRFDDDGKEADNGLSIEDTPEDENKKYIREMGFTMVPTDWYYKDRGDEENFDDLFCAMLRSSEIKEIVFNFFFNRIKPTMENRWAASISG
jgi:hypothetical protein